MASAEMRKAALAGGPDRKANPNAAEDTQSQPKTQAAQRKPRLVVRALSDLRLLLDGGQR